MHLHAPVSGSLLRPSRRDGARVAAAYAPERWPAVLLLLALCVVVATSIESPALDSDNTGFSLEYLTNAENRSPSMAFVGFRYQFLNSDGERAYQLYNRFPITGYLAIKAAILAFHDDVPAQFRAARMLMLAFFAAAMLAAYFVLKRLTSPSVALAATLLGFSSHYTLSMADIVATEGVMDLFAVMLTFHGLVVFVQQGRFVQLLAKTCTAVLIGWHVFGLLLPFIVFGLAAEWQYGDGGLLRRTGRLLRSRHVALGAVALSVGVSMLALNFGLERAALLADNEIHAEQSATLARLPSFRSMLKRTGQDPVFNTKQSITAATALRFFDYVGNAVTPYAARVAVRSLLPSSHSSDLTWAGLGESPSEHCGSGSQPAKPMAIGADRGQEMRSLVATARRFGGLLVFVAVAVGIVRARHRILLGTLATAGFCWALLAPGNVLIVPQVAGMFFVGVPLVFYSLALMQVQRRSKRAMHVCVGLALLVFASSAAHPAPSHGHLNAVSELASDKEAIHSVAPEGAVVVSCTRSVARHYLLTGRTLLSPRSEEQRQLADFVLIDGLAGDIGLLTPDNRFYFLYDRAAYDAKYAAQSSPTSK